MRDEELTGECIAIMTAEVQTPSARQIAERALTLCAVVARAYLDEGEDDHAEELRGQIQAWLVNLKLDGALYPREGALLAMPLSLLARSDQVDASWLSEGLAVFAWALSRAGWPSLDAEVDVRSLADALHFLHPEAAEVLAQPQLRAPEELVLASARLELVHARLEAFARQRTAVNLEALAAQDPLGPLVLEEIPLLEGDLRLGDRPLARADESEWQRALSLAKERHRAVLWLTGAGANYGLGDPK
jgi:hypothetical protein